MTRLLLVGASGTLGTRLARLLAAEMPELEIVEASRRPRAGGRRFDVTSPQADALADVWLVLNAAGPYRYDPSAIVRACVAAGAHYVDLAEEPGFLEEARVAGSGSGVVVAPGCSTVPGLLEVLVRGFEKCAGIERVDAFLSMGTRNEVSAALLSGLMGPLGRRAPDGSRYFGRLERRTIAGRSLSFGRHPSGLLDERLALGTHSVPVRFHAGFDRAVLGLALRSAAPLAARLSESQLGALARLTLPVARLARPFGSLRGVLRIEALDVSGQVLDFVEIEAFREGLDVPALPAVWAVRALLQGTPMRTGALVLADLVSRDQALAALAGAGFRVSGSVS